MTRRALVFRRLRPLRCPPLRVVRCCRCPWAHFTGADAGPWFAADGIGWYAIGPTGEA